MAITRRCAALLTLAAAAVTPGALAERARDEAAPLTAEQVLANPLDESAYERKARCLATARYRRVEIIGDTALVFHGRGEDVWLNMLPRRCIGLRRDMVLAIEQSNLRVCARDRFRGLTRGNFEMSTAACLLGEFEHLERDQLDAKRDALVAERANRTVRRTRRSAPEPADG